MSGFIVIIKNFLINLNIGRGEEYDLRLAVDLKKLWSDVGASS